MDELKILLEMVANLPQMAIWVIVALFAYKVVVIGSIFGIIRLAIIKTHDWLTKPRVFKIGSKAIDESVAEALQIQIQRICSNSYYHMSDVRRLQEALDVKFSKPQN